MIWEGIVLSLPEIVTVLQSTYDGKEYGSTEFPYTRISVPDMLYSSGKIFKGKNALFSVSGTVPG